MSYPNYYYSPHIYPRHEKQSLLKGSASMAVAEGSYVERLGDDKKGDLYMRSFLINSRPNARNWSVDPQTIRDNVLSIVGKPVLLDHDHPVWDTHKSADANISEQSKKAIGKVEKVFYDPNTDSYFADSKIIDPDAKSYIRKFSDKRVPLSVSPQLVYDSRTEQPNYYKKWDFTHLAILDNNKGAYGPQAVVIGTCNGDGPTCHKKLQQQALAAASASASAAASGYVLQRDTSSKDNALIGSMVWAPKNGKRPRRLA